MEKEQVDHEHSQAMIDENSAADFEERLIESINQSLKDNISIQLPYTNALEKQIKRNMDAEIDNWAKDNNILKAPYFNNCLEGNQCENVLKKLNSFDEIMPQDLKCCVKARQM